MVGNGGDAFPEIPGADSVVSVQELVTGGQNLLVSVVTELAVTDAYSSSLARGSTAVACRLHARHESRRDSRIASGNASSVCP